MCAVVYAFTRCKTFRMGLIRIFLFVHTQDHAPRCAIVPAFFCCRATAAADGEEARVQRLPALRVLTQCTLLPHDLSARQWRTRVALILAKRCGSSSHDVSKRAQRRGGGGASAPLKRPAGTLITCHGMTCASRQGFALSSCPLQGAKRPKRFAKSNKVRTFLFAPRAAPARCAEKGQLSPRVPALQLTHTPPYTPALYMPSQRQSYGLRRKASRMDGNPISHGVDARAPFTEGSRKPSGMPRVGGEVRRLGAA